MKLYFMRHGEAEQIFAGSDHDRRLTEKGTRRIETAAQMLAALGVKPAVIFASPRLRALQTATIVGAALKIEPTINEEVNFQFTAEAVRTLVADFPDQDVMFVGHNPSMSEVLQSLTGGRVHLKAGSFARVDVLNPQTCEGVLTWLIAPKVFDRLGD